MPLYEYECDLCAHRFEVIQKFSDAPIAVCPKCGGVVHKLPSSPAIQFKGSGWYITDYARSGKPDPANVSAGKDDAGAAAAKSESGESAGKGESGAPTGKTESGAGGSESGTAAKSEPKSESKPSVSKKPA
jgi:putative FmdB family regulatory protein